MDQFLYPTDETRTKTVVLRFLTNVINMIAPRADRAALVSLLHSDRRAWPIWWVNVARRVLRASLSASVKAFDSKMLAADLMCVFIGFSAAPSTSWGWILAAAALISLWRDGHTYPAEPSALAAAKDGFWIGMVLLFAGVLIVRPQEVVRAVPVTMSMIALTRFVFRLQRPDRGPIEEDYLSAWQLCILWIVGWGTLSAGYKAMFVEHDIVRDHVLGTLLIPLGLAIRFQSDSPDGVFFRKIKILSDWLHPWRQKKAELEAKENTLPGSNPDRSWEVRLGIWLFRLWFVLMALPILITAAGVWRGRIGAEEIRWIQFTVNVAVYTVLSAMWREIKAVNRQVGIELRRGIDELSTQPSPLPIGSEKSLSSFDRLRCLPYRGR
jgi:hypothetical protein